MEVKKIEILLDSDVTQMRTILKEVNGKFYRFEYESQGSEGYSTISPDDPLQPDYYAQIIAESVN